MTFSRIALAATAALALSSGVAFAGSTSRTVSHAAMPVSMDRTVGGGTTIFGGSPSAPTIWGHAVSRSVYVSDDSGTPDRAGGR